MNRSKLLLPFLLVAFLTSSVITKAQVPTPKSHFGFNIGDDYMLANYTQAEAYYKKVANASDRVLLRPIGKTEEGRNQYVIIISSPENIRNISKYQSISQKLGHAEGLSDAEARKLAQEGKAVVWIDGGLHANETVGAHQLIETLYQLASRDDEETKRILKDVVILLVHANPDGQELVSNWYMQEKDVTKRNMNIPRLYEKYIGHDNNRDFYMVNMSETQNMSKVMYVDWLPQIMYNHHQTSPAGAVVAGPPYRDPFNYVYDPLLITGIDAVGAAMINRLNTEGKPGFTRVKGSVYSTWWNGGLRTTAYFHNIIGLLTEITGNPTPSQIAIVPDRLMPDMATPFPVTPQPWHFRNSIDYSVSLNYAVLDYASRYKDQLLYNFYVMGRNSIERGSRDNWTSSPKHIDSLKSLIAQSRQNTTGNRSAGTSAAAYDSIFKAPENRDARGYILPADQADFGTAVRFINALIKSGIRVERATSAFTVEGKNYPAGSYIVKTNQAFRPHVIDMFEPQDHPNDFQYPGGPPVRPYDAAGWTLAYQMGISFDRILNDFTGPFSTIPYGELQSFAATTFNNSSAGYLISPKQNNAFIAVNDLLKGGVEVARINQGNEAGNFFVPRSGTQILKDAAQNWGITVTPVTRRPTGTTPLKPARIALYDRYGGSMPSGWVRWMMEQYHFPFELVYPKDLDKGSLNAKYDVILFIDERMPADGRPAFFRQINEKVIPEEYRGMLGNITKEKTVPELKSFMENGGNVITIGSSTSLAYLLGLPVRNALTVKSSDGKETPLSSNEYYIPGSILRLQVDNTQPENAGMGTVADMVFDQSNVFSLNPDAVSKGIKPLAWFDESDPLRSGWAWGKSYLKDGIVAFSAPVGKGKFFACATQITFRAQPHGTFRMLFNQLYANK
ncbi:MAG: peptidase [Chitinophagaceae bacterium]|nr:peptidase [Chitinophagaceae bacterium]MCZ2397385.1 M14 family metallopeptidase [Chitinophagales bacterium]